jgi:uncharacterized protein (TIGR02117 family)
MLPRLFTRKIIPALPYFLFFVGFSNPAAADWACDTTKSSCKSVFIVHGGWHAAIVLHTDDVSPAMVPEIFDFPQVRFIEFSWGDKDYFPDPHAGPFTAIKAAFWSSGSVLHLVGFAEDIARFYPGAEIIALQFAASAYGKLASYLSETFSRAEPSVAASSRKGLYPYSRFYPAKRQFGLWNTCNTWVAEALAAGGFPISPSFVITAGQLSEEISKIKSHAIVFEQRS